MSFRVGDVVKKLKRKGDFCWRAGDEHIIREAIYRGHGEIDYSTNRGAWFTDEDFVLVREADKQSLKQLDKAMREEFSEE